MRFSFAAGKGADVASEDATAGDRRDSSVNVRALSRPSTSMTSSVGGDDGDAMLT